MKIKTIIGIILIVFGTGFALYAMNMPILDSYPFTANSSYIFGMAVPSIIIGILFLLSTAGAITVLAGCVIIFILLMINHSISNQYFILPFGLIFLGIAYSIYEVAARLTKYLKGKK